MSQGAAAWSTKKWTAYKRKHRTKNSANWSRVVESTKSGPAKYKPEIDDKMQSELELSCIDSRYFLAEDGSVRSYGMDTGKVIGAYEGVETSFIYVEHSKEGTVHGYPIKEDKLGKVKEQR